MKTHSCFTVLKLHMLHLKLMLNKKKPRKETVSGQGPRPFLLLNTPASVLHERGGMKVFYPLQTKDTVIEKIAT